MVGELQHSLLAWLATYALHSTALLALAWLVTRRLPRDAFRGREWIWKTALVGPILTCTLQSGIDFEPIAGSLALPRTDEAAQTATHIPSLAGVAASALENAEHSERLDDHEQRVAFLRHLRDRARTETAGDEDRVPLLSDLPVVSGRTGTPRGLFAIREWQPIVLGLWAVLGLAGTGLLALAWRRVVDRLTGRTRLDEGPVVEILAGLCERAKVRQPRLMLSARLASPATIGVLRPQVCLPERALHDLSAEQQEAMLAHELAHIARRDPQWFFLARLVERVFFFQPLNRLARKEIFDLAEYQADDWAVAHTSRSVSLARCLTEVASWIAVERTRVAVLPMVQHGSQLSRRVRRLLDEERCLPRRRSRAVTVPVTTVLLAAGALVLPGAAADRTPIETTGFDEDPAPPATRSVGPADLGVDSTLVVESAPETALLHTSPSSLPRASGPAARLGELLDLLDLLDRQIDETTTAFHELQKEIESDDLGREDFDPRLEELRVRVVNLQSYRTKVDALRARILESTTEPTPELPTAALGQEQ